MLSEGIGVKPAFSNSLTPLGKSALERLICSTISKFTIFITTSGTSFTLSKVCLVVLSFPRLAGEKIKIGGLAPKALKKLKGDKFGFPSASTVLAKAIGRGAIAVVNTDCISRVVASLVFMVLKLITFYI